MYCGTYPAKNTLIVAKVREHIGILIA